MPFLFLVSDVSYFGFLFEPASAIVEKRTPSCEHPHLKDKGEGNQG